MTIYESTWEWDSNTTRETISRGEATADELMLLAVIAKRLDAGNGGMTNNDMSTLFYGLAAIAKRSAETVLAVAKRLEEITERFPEVEKLEQERLKKQAA